MLYDLAHVAPMAAFVFVWTMIAWMLVGDRLGEIRTRRPEASVKPAPKPAPHFRRRANRGQKAAV
ncbi:hypothetical protein Pla175_02490 [Pirellulimonas nuda]|uniref:Uncharacterized protein n=1 Tax=Pirellulimonas nuda TaxID=2528009 RepID=A0A518D602_9BACT|nr:hypothetical protein [Pirellulimonas nuda]QDU86895.1 hypothetical protein Pla175_02490 [Pirellulimonas nuda]